MFDTITLSLLALFAQAPNVGNGVAPPGSEGLLQILRWMTYIGFGCATLGVVIAGAGMALQHRHGGAGQDPREAGAVLPGALVIGSASALVNGVVV